MTTVIVAPSRPTSSLSVRLPDDPADCHIAGVPRDHETTRACWCEPVVSELYGRPVVIHRVAAPAWPAAPERDR